MKKVYLPALLLITLCHGAIAQFAPGVEWEKCIPNATVRAALSLSASSFTVGFDLKSCSDSTSAGLRNYDSDGNLIWEKIYTPGPSENYSLLSLSKASDKGYFFAGGIDSSITDTSQLNFNWIVKTDSSGNILWQKKLPFDDSASVIFGKIIELGNGNELYVADQYSAQSLRDILVMLLDASGNIIWTKSFGGSLFDNAHDVISTTDGGFVVAGYTTSNDSAVSGNHGAKDVLILKLDANGNLQWQKCFGGTNNEESRSVSELPDGYLVAAMSQSNDGDVSGHHGSTSYYDDWVFKTDASGNLLWQKSFGGMLDDNPQQMIRLADENFIITGSSYSSDDLLTDHHGSAIYDDQWTVKFDENGTVLWTKSTGGSGDDWANCIAALDSDEIIIAGADLSDNGDHHQSCFSNDCHAIEGGWIVKLNEHCSSFPAALFSVDQSGMTFTFTNESYNAQSYFWDFGDGTTSLDVSPSHTYSQSGTYHVCLSAIDSCSTKTYCQTVTSCTDSITSSFTEAYPGGTTVQFTDQSLNAAQWSWDFGDGATDTVQNPSHTYSSNGSFTVTLTVYDSCNLSNTSSQVINTCLGFTADFGFFLNGNTVSFTDSTLGLPSGWSWDFGDGNFSSDPNPVHVYAGGGTYNVCLTASADGCTPQTICKTITVCGAIFSNDFSYQVDTNIVSFYDSSQSAIGWQWDFGDGTFSTEQNPVHAYSQDGMYTVCEMIFTNCNTDTICEVIDVQCPPVSSSFSFTANNLDVTFTDLSQNATSWEWNFGDGSFSNVQNPDHLFSQAGNYLVCLVAFNNCGNDTLCGNVFVQCPSFNAAFGFIQTNDTVAFTDQSSNAIQWQWDFGDGNTSAAQNPVHIYSDDGMFYVCLIAYDGCSYDTICDSVNVLPTGSDHTPPLASSFSLFPNPAHGYVTIVYNLPAASKLTIIINDISGKMISSIEEKKFSSGLYTGSLNTGGLSPGTYFIELRSEDEFAVSKLIIQ